MFYLSDTDRQEWTLEVSNEHIFDNTFTDTQQMHLECPLLIALPAAPPYRTANPKLALGREAAQKPPFLKSSHV